MEYDEKCLGFCIYHKQLFCVTISDSIIDRHAQRFCFCSALVYFYNDELNFSNTLPDTNRDEHNVSGTDAVTYSYVEH